MVEGLNAWDGVVDEARSRCNTNVEGEGAGRAYVQNSSGDGLGCVGVEFANVND